MYNNEVTYNDKFNTEQNRAALKKLQDKFFDYSYCCPDCPVSWAPEVLELLETIHSELGLARNEGTNRGYRISGNPFTWFIKTPIQDLTRGIISAISPKYDSEKKKSFSERFIDAIKGSTRGIRYGLRAMMVLHVNPILNKLNKPKVELSQLKEKYGYLTIYFNSSDAHEEWIHREIRKTEIKLAMKGAYYPIDSLWTYTRSYSCDYEHNPEYIETNVKQDSRGKTYVEVKQTMYRKLMKDMGLDISDIAIKAMIREDAKKAGKK